MTSRPRPSGSARRPHRRAKHAPIAAFLAVAVVAAGCTGGGHSSSTTSPSPTSGGTGTQPGGTAAPLVAQELAVRLSAGHAQQSAAATPTKVVAGSALDQEGVDAVTGRLPAWTVDPSSQQAFNWPTETIGAPRAGATVAQPFPAASDTVPPATTEGELVVSRVQPQGDVALAPFLTVTFNQAMVPVGTIGQVNASAVPVELTPAIDGSWQWIGTRTLRFDAKTVGADRLPMATSYSVTVPAGTASATGKKLAKDVSFTFQTPPVTVQTLSPTGEGLRLQPVFVAGFDQRVDAAAVLAHVKVKAAGKDVDVRLATKAEIEADDTARQLVSQLTEGRYVAFRPTAPMAADAAVGIDIEAGTPSAEGPRTTTAAQHYDGHTYAPLRIAHSGCGSPCPPGSQLMVEMNNALDTKAFDPATVTVTPSLPGLSVGVSGSVVLVQGATAAHTTYTVHLPASLTDVYGQTLGAQQTATFDVGAASPMVRPLPLPFITLDPMAKQPGLMLGTVNHDKLHVRVFSVTPDDWSTFIRWYVRSEGQDGLATPPSGWKVLLDDRIDTTAKKDAFVETLLDLSGPLGGKPGHLVVIVEPTEHYGQNDPLYWQNRPTAAWVQSTSIGLDATADLDRLTILATDLATGQPLAGTPIRLVGRSDTVTTGADGVATVDLAKAPVQALVATKGADKALLTANVYDEGGWARSARLDSAAWYVLDDRGVYRPGETVSIKGWVRKLTTSADSQLALVGSSGITVGYQVTDAQGTQLATGKAAVNPLGGFDFTFAVPASANSGPANVQLSLDGASLPVQTGHQVQIEDYRTPEFEVTARTESPEPIVSTEPATVAVDASYYAGGPLPAAPVHWQVSTTSATYSPPGWTDYSFGVWIPWWDTVSGGSRAGIASGPCCGPIGTTTVEQFDGTTDASGHHYLQLDFGDAKGAKPDLPVTVTAEATVQDVNRQAWASRTQVLVHPAALYVGLRSAATFVRQGEPIDVDAVVTDIDGKAVSGKAIEVVAARLTWSLVNGEWTEQPTDPQTCKVTSSATPVACHFTTGLGGTYRISSTVVDDRGGANRTELTRWVGGAEASRPQRTVTAETLTIVPDKQTYRPGDTAKVLVQAPFPGHGQLIVARAGIAHSTIAFDAADGSAVVEVPIADSDVPGVDLSFNVAGAATRTGDDGKPLADAPKRPAFATGQITLAISTATRALTVKVTPAADKVVPGATTKLAIQVTDGSGAPVGGADVAAIVVDEAVLAVTAYKLADPLTVFYGQLPSYLQQVFGRQSVVLADAGQLTGESGSGGATAETAAAAASSAASTTVAAPSLAAGGEAARDADTSKTANGYDQSASTTPIAARSDFAPLAVFAPHLSTDAAGKASVDVPLPDNLTRYRVMAVAVSGADRFGSGESTITARLPLMVRPSAPRFANFGDHFELPVVLQNQTDAPMTVDVALQTSNLTVSGAGAVSEATAGRRVDVPANDRVEVRFPVATEEAGTARFRVAGASGDAADAAVVALPVYTPATAEAFATYGVLDGGATVQPVLAPTGVVPQFGGLSVTTSSTAVSALTDAFIEVTKESYGGADSRASRILVISALRGVLAAFDAPGLPSKAELDATVKADVGELVAMQNDDGGFGWWERNRPSDPYVSLLVTRALVTARRSGFDVPANAYDRALAYAKDIDAHLSSELPDEERALLQAYALRVRQLAGDRDSARAKQLWDQRGERQPLAAIAMLWPEVDDAKTDAAIERVVQNKAVDTAGAVTFTTGVTDAANIVLSSDRRTDALLLDALIAKRPTSDLIPKVVQGLLGARKGGRWSSFSEDTDILVALEDYFDAYEKATPDFVARVWLGSRYAGGHAFKGRSTDRVEVTIPTQELIDAGNTDVVVADQGTGRLYYRIGLRYAPASLQLDPADRGFVVARTYEAVDDPADVRRDADGTWHVKAGAKVRVRVTMVAESQRTQVALVDPLPAGLEILNPALATTPDTSQALSPGTVTTIPGDVAAGSSAAASAPICIDWCAGSWFEHQNAKDDRAEAFASLLPAGAYEYVYVARATTPGTFVTPPARAEERYAPETFGRSSTATVVVDA